MLEDFRSRFDEKEYALIGRILYRMRRKEYIGKHQCKVEGIYRLVPSSDRGKAKDLIPVLAKLEILLQYGDRKAYVLNHKNFAMINAIIEDTLPEEYRI